jgi:beta-glucanase (GH16 family)
MDVLTGLARAVIIFTSLFEMNAEASAQTKTFDSVDMAQWPASFSWAPGGHITSDMSSWITAAGAPADAQTAANVNGVLALNIIPRPADVSASAAGGASLLCALLTTHDTFSQTYGYFEMNAQMPAVNGSMGAFWLLPENGSRPPELDVVEVVAKSPTIVVNTIITGISAAVYNHWTTVADTSAGFHTYAVDWQPTTLTWYFDGVQTFQQATPADMHQPMYMILDIMSGTPSSWEGSMSSTKATMLVKYVRAWTSKPSEATATVTPEATTAAPATAQTTTTTAASSTESTAPTNETPVTATPTPHTHKHQDHLWFEHDSDHEHAWRKDHDHPDQ